jgi:hypothetical protein
MILDAILLALAGSALGQPLVYEGGTGVVRKYSIRLHAAAFSSEYS